MNPDLPYTVTPGLTTYYSVGLIIAVVVILAIVVVGVWFVNMDEFERRIKVRNAVIGALLGIAGILTIGIAVLHASFSIPQIRDAEELRTWADARYDVSFTDQDYERITEMINAAGKPHTKDPTITDGGTAVSYQYDNRSHRLVLTDVNGQELPRQQE